MKHLTILLVVSIFIISCKKNGQLSQKEHEHKSYRVYFISKSMKDTTYTPTRGARTETVGLDSASDSKLKAVLLSYNGHGVYDLQVTNLTNCQQIIRWNWEGGFKIDSIGYPSNNPLDPSNDVLKANQTKIFTIYGPAKTGKLKLKAESTCGNSSTLIINITTAILPIVYMDYTVSYDEVANKHVISFKVESPQDVNLIGIEQLIGKEYKLVAVIPGDDATKQYAIKL